MTETLILTTATRDWVEWVVDVGGILAAFASLLAIVVAVVALFIARDERRDARQQREWERFGHRLQALRRIYRALTEITGFSIDRNVAEMRSLQRELRVLLATAGLRSSLPRVAAVVDLEYDETDEWRNSMHLGAWKAVTEVDETLENEADHASVGQVLG